MRRYSSAATMSMRATFTRAPFSPAASTRATSRFGRPVAHAPAGARQRRRRGGRVSHHRRRVLRARSGRSCSAGLRRIFDRNARCRAATIDVDRCTSSRAGWDASLAEPVCRAIPVRRGGVAGPCQSGCRRVAFPVPVPLFVGRSTFRKHAPTPVPKSAGSVATGRRFTPPDLRSSTIHARGVSHIGGGGHVEIPGVHKLQPFRLSHRAAIAPLA